MTATTNNQAVQVDFASWVMDSTAGGIVLGNVQAVSPPTRAEDVYSVVDNGDGTVDMMIAPIGTWSNGPSPVLDSNGELATAYESWRRGSVGKPVPRRCGGALYLSQTYGEPLPSGQCDAGLIYPTQYAGGRWWSAVSGTTAPMNQYMQLPQANPNVHYVRGTSANTLKRVLGETYIHMWEPNFDVNRAFNGSAAATGSPCDATSEGPGAAFDGHLAPSDGTKWCVGVAPSRLAPAAIMYTFRGGGYPITSYAVTSAGGSRARDPRDWVLEGCSGSCTVGSSIGWVTIDVRTNQTFADRWQMNRYNLWNNVAYSKIRMKITANGGDRSTELGEIQLFDAPGCIPQTDADLCGVYGRNCGSFTGADNCGATRTVASCGTCASGLTCGGGGVANACGGSCAPAYVPSKCLTFKVGQRVSNGGRNWSCASPNCNNCGLVASCAPGASGCPWGAVWRDDGACR